MISILVNKNTYEPYNLFKSFLTNNLKERAIKDPSLLLNIEDPDELYDQLEINDDNRNIHD